MQKNTGCFIRKKGNSAGRYGMSIRGEDQETLQENKGIGIRLKKKVLVAMGKECKVCTAHLYHKDGQHLNLRCLRTCHPFLNYSPIIGM